MRPYAINVGYRKQRCDLQEIAERSEGRIKRLRILKKPKQNDWEQVREHVGAATGAVPNSATSTPTFVWFIVD